MTKTTTFVQHKTLLHFNQ